MTPRLRRNRRLAPAHSRAAAGARRLGPAALLLALTAGVAAGLARLQDPATMPIREVRMEGEFREVSPQRLQALVQAAIDGGFFTVDVGRVRSALLAEPWVAAADVQRVWPDALVVTVRERIAVARWRGAALLDAGGVVFSPPPATMPAGLPVLEGRAGSERLLLDRFRELEELLAGSGLIVRRLGRSGRGAWRFELAGGPVVIVGREEFRARLRRFVASLEQLRAYGMTAIDAIDLRYTNGLAIRMRAPAQGEEAA